MSQNIVDFSGNPTGAGLMDDYLNKELQNILTSNSGIQRPSYAVAGTKWIDMSATPWLLKMYDGTDDVVIGTIDPSTHKFIASIPLTTTGDLIVQNKNGKPDRLASGTAGTILTSNGIGKVPSWQKLSIDMNQDKSTAVNYNNITNCITYIPQNIVELGGSTGHETLLVNGIAYIPNGFENDGVTPKFIKSNRTNQTHQNLYHYTGSYMFFVQNGVSGVVYLPVSYCYSGPTAPTEFFISNNEKLAFWYDTINNLVKFTRNGGSTWTSGYSLPIYIATYSYDKSKFTSIDQVFNGFGYIGSTVFALPGVKGLIPNGRNADGSLKSIEFETRSVLTFTRAWNTSTPQTWFIDKNLSMFIYDHYIESTEKPSTINTVWYIPSTNITYRKERSGDFVELPCIPISSVGTGGSITSFKPKTVFHAVDYNDVVSKSGDTMTGNLIINNREPSYFLKSNTLDLSQTFTDNKNDAFIIEQDKNGKHGCFITFRHDIYDSNVAEIVASNGVDSNRKLVGMGIWVRKNGENGTYAPQCNYDASIVTTVSHGDNWIRFGNGLQICWGSVTVGDGAQVYQNLPQAFKDTNYIVTFGHQNFTNSTTDFYHPQLINGKKTATNFTVYCRNAGSYHNAAVTWIAIGYWY